MGWKAPTRAEDERLLLMLRLRKRGVAATAIAEAAGVDRKSVENALCRVRVADRDESGEPADVVARGYR